MPASHHTTTTPSALQHRTPPSAAHSTAALRVLTPPTGAKVTPDRQLLSQLMGWASGANSAAGSACPSPDVRSARQGPGSTPLGRASVEGKAARASSSNLGRSAHKGSAPAPQQRGSYSAQHAALTAAATAVAAAAGQRTPPRPRRTPQRPGRGAAGGARALESCCSPLQLPSSLATTPVKAGAGAGARGSPGHGHASSDDEGARSFESMSVFSVDLTPAAAGGAPQGAEAHAPLTGSPAQAAPAAPGQGPSPGAHGPRKLEAEGGTVEPG